MFKLRCPIPKKYFTNEGFCKITQLFAENRYNKYKDWGLYGHTGIDFRVKFVYRWFRNWMDKRIEVSGREKIGEIPILAAHDGYLVREYNDDPKVGIGMKIRSEDIELFGRPCQIETSYFHLSGLRIWKGDDLHTGWEKIKGENFVKAGTIIGWSGNTGKYTTGAHLHFSLKPYWKKGNKYIKDYNNGYAGSIDPMPFLKGKYEMTNSYGWNKTRFLNGKPLT